MSKDCTIQDVFHHFYSSFESTHDISPAQRKAAYHIMNCKTGAFGVNVSVCHKGRVMNMRWGRFGSINICLLIDWCNEPTKKIPLGAGRLSFGRFGKTGIPSGGRPLRTSGPELPVVSRWDSKFLCCSMIRVENTLPENALGRRNRLYGRKTG